MNKFAALKDQFRSGTLSKMEYVQAMYAEHARCFDYSACLNSVNISEIRIRAEGVVAEFRDPKISMICPPGDLRIAPIEAFNFGDYEHDEIQTVRRIFEKLGGVNVKFFDIGANAGFYSLALTNYFPGIKGVAFEPVPTTFTSLKANFALNNVSGIEAHNIGLSNKAGELIFYTYPSQSGASSMTRNVDSPDVVEVRCRVVRLDDHCREANATAGFIKCDVEGAELFVFQGAEQTIVRDRPVIFTEMLRKWCAKYSYHPNDIISFFRTLGYSCFTMSGMKLAACESVTLSTTETNFLFLHPETHQQVIQGLS